MDIIFKFFAVIGFAQEKDLGMIAEEMGLQRGGTGFGEAGVNDKGKFHGIII
jgi:hypothetical protein